MPPLEMNGVLSEPIRAPQYWRELREMSSTLGFLGDQVVRLNRELEEVKKQRDEAVTQLEKIKLNTKKDCCDSQCCQAQSVLKPTI